MFLLAELVKLMWATITYSLPLVTEPEVVELKLKTASDGNEELKVDMLTELEEVAIRVDKLAHPEPTETPVSDWEPVVEYISALIVPVAVKLFLTKKDTPAGTPDSVAT